MHKLLSTLLLVAYLLVLPTTARTQLVKGMQTFLQAGDFLWQTGNDNPVIRLAYRGEQAQLLNERIMLGSGAGGSLLAESQAIFGLTANPFARYYFNPNHANFHSFIGLEGRIDNTFSSRAGKTDFALFPHLGANLFLQADISIRAKAGLQFSLGARVPSVVNIVLDFEPFFTAEAWNTRKQQTYTLNRGDWLVRSPSLTWSLVERTSTVDLQTGVFYMATRTLAVGADVGYQNPAHLDRLIRLEALLRYYFTQRHSSWFFHAQAGPSIRKNSSFPDRENITTYNLFLGGGMNVFLSARVAVDMRFGLNVTAGDLIESTRAIAGQLGMVYVLSPE